MFAVGVDVANGRSMVAVLDGMRNMVAKPFEVVHTAQGFATLVEKLRQLDGEVRIVMEHTGRYYESFANDHASRGILCFRRESIAHQELPGQHQCPQGEDGQGGRAKNRAIRS